MTIKICWARQMEVVIRALIKELDKKEPDYTTVAMLNQDIKNHTVFIADKLETEGVLILDDIDIRD
jgi:hypothetical protein